MDLDISIPVSGRGSSDECDVVLHPVSKRRLCSRAFRAFQPLTASPRPPRGKPVMSKPEDHRSTETSRLSVLERRRPRIPTRPIPCTGQ